MQNQQIRQPMAICFERTHFRVDFFMKIENLKYEKQNEELIFNEGGIVDKLTGIDFFMKGHEM